MIAVYTLAALAVVFAAAALWLGHKACELALDDDEREA